MSRLITIGGDDTAFSALKLAEKSAGRIRVVHVPKTIDNDLGLPAAHRHLRLSDGAPRRCPARHEPHGRRLHHLALVHRHRHGAQGRPPGARHRQGGGRDADADRRGVRRRARCASLPSSTPWSAPSSSARRRGGATASPWSPRAWCSTSIRKTSPASRTSSATRTATSAWRRSISVICSNMRSPAGSRASASRPPWWRRTSATSCAAPIPSRTTWSTPATSATAPPSTCSKAATRR